MNFIIIVSDTLRRDHLGCYGNEWISTPNIDKLASQSVVFDHAYTGSFPTVPNRTDLMTGRFCFAYTDWAPLSPKYPVMAEMLGKAGYVSMFIVDTPHLMNNGYHFDRGFSGWQWIRGQENDRLMTDPVEVRLPCAPAKLRGEARTVTQYLRNVSQRRYEEDYFAPRTMSEAARWLERNRKQDKFLLYVDTFDPHEPWDPPQYYTDLYDPGYQGEEVIYPIYGPANYLTPAELKHMRALYAGEVTMVDRWVGMLLRKVEELGLLDTTAIIFTTDHGFYLGEHGLTGKVVMLYEEVTHIPLMVRLPGMRSGFRCGEIVQPADVLPTILELAKVEAPESVQGRSFKPLLEGKREGRPFAVSSYAIIHAPVEAVTDLRLVNPYEWAKLAARLKPSTVSDREWTLICGAGDFPPELYHLPCDPQQAKNVFAENRPIAEGLHRQYVELLETAGTAQEFVAPRRKL